MQFDWSQEDRFVSNYGEGPLTARVLCCTSKEITLERWHKRWKRPTRFSLPLKFFLSPDCGWVKNTAPSPSTEGAKPE